MKRLRALEPYYMAQLRIALMRQAEAGAALYEAGATPELAAAFVKPDYVAAPVRGMIRACATAEAAETYVFVGQLLATAKAAKPRPGVPPGAAQRIENFLNLEAGKDIKNITETTRKQVREALVEAQRQGLGRQEAANLLRERVATLAPRRALVIVRTELITAANFGSLSGAQAHGVPLLKRWIATPGDRTRIDHQLAHGEKADLFGVFEDIGGEHAQYPGDPNLSVRQRVNCRCSIGYEPPK